MESEAKKVVIIDDSRTTLMLIENLLFEISNKIQVRGFDKAEYGLKYLKAHKPDLLIIDLFMPQISGLELLEKIQPSEGMKVFMISANTKVVNIESALKLGIDEYFTKPLKVEKLASKIKSVLYAKEKHEL